MPVYTPTKDERRINQRAWFGYLIKLRKTPGGALRSNQLVEFTITHVWLTPRQLWWLERIKTLSHPT